MFKRQVQELLSQKRLIIAMLLIAAVGLLCAAAMAEPKRPAPEGWVQLNREVALALEQPEQLAVLGEEAAPAPVLHKDVFETAAAEKTGDVNEETKTMVGAGESKQITGETGSLENSGVTEEETAGIKADAANDEPLTSRDANGKLDINRASAVELDELKGIGPAKAEAIVEYREVNGRFQSVEDLRLVKGIGPKILQGMKDSIVARP